MCTASPMTLARKGRVLWNFILSRRVNNVEDLVDPLAVSRLANAGGPHAVRVLVRDQKTEWYYRAGGMQPGFPLSEQSNNADTCFEIYSSSSFSPADHAAMSS